MTLRSHGLGRWAAGPLRAAVCLLLGGAVAAACSRGNPPPRNVVLVVVDTLRADHLGVYGYSRPTSPRMDRLAQQGILFREALSPTPWTLPALATIMTSLYPSLHGAHSPSDLRNTEWRFRPEHYRPLSALHESRLTLAEVLRAAGFRTYGAVQGSYPSSAFGMDQGFDVYHENATPGIRFDVEDALGWLDEHQPSRFLIYLHVIEVHSPYTPLAPFIEDPDAAPDAARQLSADRLHYFDEAVAEERLRFLSLDFDPGYRGPVDGTRENLQSLAKPGARMPRRDVRHLVALYDRGIAYVDHWIGVLLDGLSERGLDSRTLVVVTSDHGEEFLEHGGFEHSYSYYEEMLRVPLLMRIPDEGAGIVVPRPVGLVDIMPTVLDVLGVERVPGLQGDSLRPLWRDGSESGADSVASGENFADSSGAEYWGEASFRRGVQALRSGGWKYVGSVASRKSMASPPEQIPSPPREELYDLSRDPRERVNRCRAERERCAAYRRRLAARIEAQRQAARELALPEPQPARIDEAVLERLRALGYVE
jgi:arylsulfatase A-like enzyme